MFLLLYAEQKADQLGLYRIVAEDADRTVIQAALSSAAKADSDPTHYRIFEVAKESDIVGAALWQVKFTI